MRDFIKGMFIGGDDQASMGKVMTWIIFWVILAGWAFWPDRPLESLVGMFGLTLAYALGGKAAFHFGRAGGRNRNQTPEHGIAGDDHDLAD